MLGHQLDNSQPFVNLWVSATTQAITTFLRLGSAISTIFKKHDYRILYMTLHDLMMSRKVALKINCDTSTKYVWNIHMDMGQNLWYHNWRGINSHKNQLF